MKKLITLLLLSVLVGCSTPSGTTIQGTQITQQPIQTEAVQAETQIPLTPEPTNSSETAVFDINSIPTYSGNPYIIVNNNIPYFTESDYTTKSFETYSPLDELGRCGVAYANIGIDIMPTEERGSIGNVKPSGWHTIKYECVDGKYLYNRCHLIGFQLSGENDNIRNLITGTRSLNVDAMLDFENMVADYVQSTNNHVLYRVTPVFDGDNLLATGVLMEGHSVEDNEICFNVFCYNEQPGIIIDHSNGESKAKDGSLPYGSSEVTAKPQESNSNQQAVSYIANKNSKKFHYPLCSSVSDMKEKNKKPLNCTRDEAISQGYSPCGRCNP